MVNNTIVENLAEAEAALERYISSFKTVEAASLELGVSRVFLWKMRNRKKPISEAVLEKIGFERSSTTTVEYKKKEEI